VYLGSTRSGALAALTLTVALSGCGDISTDAGWFRKPMDAVGRNSGYQYSDLQESRQTRPITEGDLVNASGSCPPPQASPQAQAQAAAAGPAPPASDGALLGEGVGLGMTECEVVYRAGPPNSVQIGSNPNGDRTALLSYQSGPRPGVYHFERGRLMQMDRVEVPELPPQTAKKKPAKPKKTATQNNPA
jgi:hypothetical protein